MKTISIPAAFTEPTLVAVEATIEVCWDLNLDVWEGEQFDYVQDVMWIDRVGHVVRFETVRTIKRMGRPIYEIPAVMIKSIRVPEDTELKANYR